MKYFFIVYCSILFSGCASIEITDIEPNQENCEDLGLLKFRIRAGDSVIRRVIKERAIKKGANKVYYSGSDDLVPVEFRYCFSSPKRGDPPALFEIEAKIYNCSKVKKLKNN